MTDKTDKTDKKDRERVIAEITLSHLMRLGKEQGCPVSWHQVLAFLNQEGRAFEMWKHMMHAAEEFIAGSLFQHSFSSRGHNGFAPRFARCDQPAMPRCSVFSCLLRPFP